MSDDDQRDDTTNDGADDDSSQDDSTDSPADTSAPAPATSSASDDDDDDDDAPAAAPRASLGVTGGATPQRTSAGARLAAAKAAKAATKAAKKQVRRDEAGVTETAAEREAEDRAQVQSAEEVLKESPLGRAATRAGEWTQANSQLAMGALGIAALALVGWIGWTYYTGSQAASAGTLLASALEISSAQIVPADAEPAVTTDEEDADPAPTFETTDARNAAALIAYRRVSSEFGSSDAAAWARVGEGRTLLAQGEYADARTAYEAAFNTSGDETILAWQALEGIGASYEAEHDWEHATAAYERLAALADHAYQSAANYHLARMHAAAGDEPAALSSFRELVDALREESDDGEPPFPYVLAQADQRLRELDPSAVGAGPNLGGGEGGEGGGGSGIDGLTPEQLQELIRRMQAEQAAGGGAGGPPPE